MVMAPLGTRAGVWTRREACGRGRVDGGQAASRVELFYVRQVESHREGVQGEQASFRFDHTPADLRPFSPHAGFLVG